MFVYLYLYASSLRFSVRLYRQLQYRYIGYIMIIYARLIELDVRL